MMKKIPIDFPEGFTDGVGIGLAKLKREGALNLEFVEYYYPEVYKRLVSVYQEK